MDLLCKMYVSFWVTEGSSFEMLKTGGSDISNDTAIRVISTLMQSVRIMQVRIVNSDRTNAQGNHIFVYVYVHRIRLINLPSYRCPALVKVSNMNGQQSF